MEVDDFGSNPIYYIKAGIGYWNSDSDINSNPGVYNKYVSYVHAVSNDGTQNYVPFSNAAFEGGWFIPSSSAHLGNFRLPWLAGEDPRKLGAESFIAA